MALKFYSCDIDAAKTPSVKILPPVCIICTFNRYVQRIIVVLFDQVIPGASLVDEIFPFHLSEDIFVVNSMHLLNDTIRITSDLFCVPIFVKLSRLNSFTPNMGGVDWKRVRPCFPQVIGTLTSIQKHLM